MPKHDFDDSLFPSRGHDPFPTTRQMQRPPTVTPLRSTVAEEVVELRERIEELIYWVRPMTGALVTGKAAVEEYERLCGRGGV